MNLHAEMISRQLFRAFIHSIGAFHVQMLPGTLNWLNLNALLLAIEKISFCHTAALRDD